MASQEETIYGNMTTSMSSESGALGGGKIKKKTREIK